MIEPPKDCPILTEQDIRFVAESINPRGLPLPAHIADIKKGVVYHNPNGLCFLAQPCRNCLAKCPAWKSDDKAKTRKAEKA